MLFDDQQAVWHRGVGQGVSMAMLIPENAWQAIDEDIFANQLISAIQRIRDASGCGISEAVGKVSERYSTLRVQRPERFSCSHENYWDGFYS
jgi:hypothetical protein